MKTTVCSLFEGAYSYGIGALANSLVASGYQGDFWVGYRGTLPDWVSPIRDSKAGRISFEVSKDVMIHFVLLETPTHFAYYKPIFLEQVLTLFAPEANAAIYLDPDIVIKGPWGLFNQWPEGGVALVHDVHSMMPSRHPMRLAWKKTLSLHGLSADVERDRYYNSGFVGIARTQLEFLKTWARIVEIAQAEIGQVKGVKHSAAGDIFHTPDQDAMNIALMVSDVPVNAAHSESMDFETGGFLMSHAIGSPKPWAGGFVRMAIKGVTPSLPSKCFLQYADGPIRLFSTGHLKRLRLSMRIASAIGRFYRRA
jgi:hypothetical protein